MTADLFDSPFGMDTGTLLSRLSHELKNPVAAALLATQMLVREVEEEHRQTLRQLEQQLRVSDWTLDVVLDINRKAEGRLRLSLARQPLSRMLAPVIEGCEVEFRRRVELETDGDESEALLDRNRVRNLVAQLLRNAFRYSEGRVWLGLRALDTSGCEISVTDEGPGFPLELIGGDLRPRPDRTGGLGLGLVFCQLVAREHGGELRLENLTPGARATVILPTPA